ncbi:Six-hairpin glycosidase-like protein [Aspergillus granulosus]|uniref:Six-hairpin glycosidase-like protein n=1 Tax=Aspergillus granulosus TaxID=176169 RepID=A0ABR4GRZ1_9EURO
MAAQTVDTTWMWHPSFTEERTDTAGLFVHFRRTLELQDELPASLRVSLTADTRYKLYVNRRLVRFGPVKGDHALWFTDEVDLAPYLVRGVNHIRIHVLRFFYATAHASSFPRLPSGGVRIVPLGPDDRLGKQVQSSPLWETAIDPTTVLRIDEPEDDFLNIYEKSVPVPSDQWTWEPARVLEFQSSTGLSAPWKVSNRMIPDMQRTPIILKALHNIDSSLPRLSWEATLLSSDPPSSRASLHLPAHSTHSVDIECPSHVTAFLSLHFTRPPTPGSRVTLTYAESYEEQPTLVPYLRRKGNRLDTTKSIHGPRDMFELQGSQGVQHLRYYQDEETEEAIIPFHFRTFRFIRLQIQVGASDLVFKGVGIDAVNYPLDILASLRVEPQAQEAEGLWNTSMRTLVNCMHDCYEDCPFYEQLQYAMDTRSSILFTYYVSGDDRLARQAILQLAHSFQPALGLTSSRAPTHQPQVIPHFSLFWICMLYDHMQFFADKAFLCPLVPIADAILSYFADKIDPALGLVVIKDESGIWHFHDWTDEWRPYGIPPAATRTGVSTYTNCLYAYTLQLASHLQRYCLGREAVAEEYMDRSRSVANAVRRHCFDGEYFTDSLSTGSDAARDRSQHGQVWAVLCGAAEDGDPSRNLLRRSLDPSATFPGGRLIQASVAMSFYSLRALSKVGGPVYEELFHGFWKPWHEQLALGLTTWEEDSVSQRSDCHAWGATPLHEFMAEVVGLRPVEPGWSTIEFRPRAGLYRGLNATVPFRTGSEGDSPMCLADVSWSPTDSGEVVVSLRVRGLQGRAPIRLMTLSLPDIMMENDKALSFAISHDGFCTLL